MLNESFLMLGIESWKPLLSAIFVSPLPLIALVLVGACLMRPRRSNLGWILVLFGCAGLWLSSTEAAARYLTGYLLQPPSALSAAEIVGLRNASDTAIVVLGGGRRVFAPEYGGPTLTPRTS